MASGLSMLAVRGGMYEIDVPHGERETYLAALRHGEEALDLSRSMGWRAQESFVLSHLAMARGYRGDYTAALSLAGEALQIADEIEHDQWRIQAHGALGAI